MSCIHRYIAASGLILSWLAADAGPAAGQHGGHADRDSAAAVRFRLGAHGVPLATRATPTAGRRHLTEGYLSQPAIMGSASGATGWWDVMLMVNLEGLTLARGELTTGTYGEGYVDRRHPHAYLHEVVATLRAAPSDDDIASLSAGRGFATFGSDDPMVRPFVKYPVNHHLAQVLERAFVSAAWRRGVVGIEASIFNGDEPTRPADLPTLDRIGDSWAARVTIYPLRGVELSASHAAVASPEVAAGFGMDARKWHTAARIERGALYALAEWARSTDVDDGRQGASYGSLLAEGAVTRGPTRVALRVERTDRHEEERLENPFRTPPSTGDPHQLAVTRWTTVTGSASRAVGGWWGMQATPFVEAAFARVSLRAGLAFDPDAFYGARSLAMLSAGVRLRAGARHDRMGRYGVAASAQHSGH